MYSKRGTRLEVMSRWFYVVEKGYRVLRTLECWQNIQIISPQKDFQTEDSPCVYETIQTLIWVYNVHKALKTDNFPSVGIYSNRDS